jgi:hypothetical protein
VIAVPKGFVTDGASVPQFLWSLLPVWANWSSAAVIHDYLCALIANNTPHPEAPTRYDADRIFLEAMESLNVGWVPRRLLYWGVRLGAWLNVKTTMIAYNHHLQRYASRLVVASGGARSLRETAIFLVLLNPRVTASLCSNIDPHQAGVSELVRTTPGSTASPSMTKLEFRFRNAPSTMSG